MARLDAGDVACWLFKTARPAGEAAPGWRPGTERTLPRCVRRSYRLDLVRPGAPCLLWRSGPDRPGVWAIGTVAAEPAEADGGPVIAVRLTLLGAPIARAELLADSRFRDAEVVRMAAGSNPSWLSAAQYAAVLDRLAGAAPAGGAVAPGTMVGCAATGSGGERSAGS